MKKVMLCLFSVVLLSSNVYAGNINDVLRVYGIETLEEDYTVDDLNKALNEYELLKNSYNKSRISTVSDNINPVTYSISTLSFLDSEIVRSEEYIRELVRLEADLSVIADAENDYRSLVKQRYDIMVANDDTEYSYEGVTFDELNSAYETVQMIYSVIPLSDLGDTSGIRVPVKTGGTVVKGFGKSEDNLSWHSGVDINTQEDAKVTALLNGQVAKIGYTPDVGNYVVINHDSRLQTQYLHLENVQVSEGQTVSQYEEIGTVSETEKEDVGEVHLTVFVDGQAVDPTLLLE